MQTSLKRIREQRGLAAASLAHRIGVERQTIYAIEAGTYVPNTTIALRLAAVLETTVEQLFSPNNRDTPTRVMNLTIAGCDPALRFLASELEGYNMDLVTLPSGSHRALNWLKEGMVPIAGSHILDAGTGTYNLPAIKRLFDPKQIKVVTFANWQQGLMLRRNNGKDIRGMADLARKEIRFLNREGGSESRKVVERELRTLGIKTKGVTGWRHTATGHLPAAWQIANGEADCCVGAETAARHFGLRFLPLTTERFDLTMTAESWHLPGMQTLLDTLSKGSFRKRLHTLAGHDTSETGTIRL
ncbi:MAG: helix-turn-helix domain-containing protein [Rhodospirillales bacterium]|nr:helix-turn-helix domain-containing protein [Acetobacter sp.]